MKQKFKFMAMMLLGILLSINNLWAETWTWTASEGSLGTTSPNTISLNEKSWTVTRSRTNYTGWNNNCVQLGSSANPETITLSSSAFTGTIQSVSITCASADGKHTVAINVGSSSYLAATATAAGASSASEKSGSGSASGEIRITLSAGTGAGAAFIKALSVTYTGGAAPATQSYDIVPNNAFWGTSYTGVVQGVTANNFNQTGTSNGITIVMNNNSATSGYINDNKTHVYNNYTLTFTAPTGYNLKRIFFTEDGTNHWANNLTATAGTVQDKKTWTGSCSEVTLGFDATSYIASIRVTLESSGPKAPVITAQPTGATYGQGDAAAAMSITASDATSYQWYSNTTNSNKNGTIISGATEASYTPSTAATGTTYYYCVATNSAGSTASNTATIVVNAPATKHTVTWSVNGNTSWKTEVAESADIEFTAPISNIPDGYVFKGWYGTTYGPSDDAPTFVTSATMGNTDKIYYAVFASAEGVGGDAAYVLVESALDNWAGDYLIVYNNTYAMNTHSGTQNTNTFATYTDISEYYTEASKSIASNSTTDALIYRAAVTANGYSLYCVSDNSYLGITANTTSTGAKLRWNTSYTESADDWTLGVGSVGNVGSNTLYIRWNNNSGSYRFAAYASNGQQAIQLFKKEDGATYSDYRTSVGPAFTVSAVANDGALGSVSVSGNVITATPKECVGYAAPAYTVTSGTASVAQEGNTFTVTPSEDCVVTINFAVTIEDTYLDNVQDWTASAKYCGSYSAPSIADKTRATSGSCEELHYHFIGWTTAEHRNSPSGHITEAGAAMTASGTTYYAVWAKEAE